MAKHPPAAGKPAKFGEQQELQGAPKAAAEGTEATENEQEAPQGGAQEPGQEPAAAGPDEAAAVESELQAAVERLHESYRERLERAEKKTADERYRTVTDEKVRQVWRVTHDRAVERTERAKEKAQNQRKGTDDYRKAWGAYFKSVEMESYEPVHLRLLQFLADYPDGMLYGCLLDVRGDSVMVRSYVYLDRADFEWAAGPDGGPMFTPAGDRLPAGKIAATEMKVRNLRAIGGIDGAMTQAHGRALGALGYGIEFGLASQEDMGDVARAEDAARRERKTTAAAPQPDEGKERTPGSHEGFRKWKKGKGQARAGAGLNGLQQALGVLIDRRKTVELAEIEEAFGPLAEMDEDLVRYVGGRLKAAKSREDVERLLAAPGKQALAWRDWPGGDEREQALSYLTSLLGVLSAADKPAALEAQRLIVPLDDIGEAPLGQLVQREIDRLASAVNLPEVDPSE